MTAHRASRGVLDVIAGTPRESLLIGLLENLAHGIAESDGAQPRLRLVQTLEDVYLQRLAAWPETDGGYDSVDVVTFPVPGVGLLEISPTPDLTVGRRRRLLDDTCTWLGATVRAERAVRKFERARRDALQSEQDAERAEVRAGHVREGERIRLVETIKTATVHDVAALRRLLAQPADTVEWPPIHALAERLIGQLRDTVRGVFPAMLPERGVEEALRELAAASPVHVRVDGGLGRRTSWDVESGFYHAAAGALTIIARAGGPVTLTLRRASGLVATLRGSASDTGAVERALRVDGERIGSLGGHLVVRARGHGEVEVVVTMPDRGEVSFLPMTGRQIAARPVFTRVATLVDAAGLPSDELGACRDGLVAPVTLLVVQGPSPVPLPGVQTVQCDEAADAALAAEVRDRHGRWGSIDAVVCALAPCPGFVDVLADDQLLFRDGVAPAEAVAALSARAPVLVARRVLDLLSAFASREGIGALRWEIDRLRAHSHELVEDGLLDEFARGTAPPIVDAGAATLAGAAGGGSRVRLGLPPDADDEDVRAAALKAVDRWQRAACRPGLGGAGQRAAAVLQRSAAGLLDREDPGSVRHEG